MYLKSLELIGFKSFSKKSILEFKTAITAIVGPNGSGKSNVAESFRFVLGEQSIKSMRGKKGEDLIWNGSKEMSRQNRASAKVTFDNSSRLLDVDFDEVSLERVVHRDGINEYFINGSSVRLKDIMELLAKAHIGSSGHHIISQGEADRILNANIRERREMVEDALGLKIYQFKRKESEKKLEKTEENMKQVESLRREIAPHLKFLKKQVEKVEKAAEMRNELSALYKEYFKREEEYIKKEKQKIAEEKLPAEKHAHELAESLANAKRILEQSAGRDEKSAELISLEGKLASVRTEKDSVTRNVGRIEGMIGYEEKRIQKIKSAGAEDPNKTLALAEVHALRGEVEEKIKQSEQTEDAGKLRTLFAEIRELISTFIIRHSNSVDQNALAESEKEIEQMVNEKKYFEEKALQVEEQLTALNVQYRALQETINREKDSSRDAEKAVFKIMAEQNETHSTLAIIKSKEQRLFVEEENFRREIQEGAALIGRAVTEFHSFEIPNLEEAREMQDERRKRIERIKIRLEDAGAAGGDEILKEFREVSERDTFLEKEIADLHLSAEALKKLIVELGEKLDQEFRQGVEKINTQFQNYFALMFGGGTAALSVVKEQKKKRGKMSEDGEDESAMISALEGDEDGPGEEGIDIAVTLPRKKIKGLVMLSGGERALTSIALLFAVSQVNPPPFIILDETDAALDEANSRKYGEMVASLSKHSQLILITHNRETMSRAGVLYGVTMGADGGSKLLSIAFEEAVQVAK